MSYCRWSTNDFQCDLYCYDHVDGYYATHVAGNRVMFTSELPEPISYDHKNNSEWFDRYNVVMKMVDDADREPIGLPYDGESFEDATLEDFRGRLLMLREAGYNFPDFVLEDIECEIKERDGK